MDLYYTAEHEWIAIEGDAATIGITDHAQQTLGDLVFIQLPEVGAKLGKGAEAGVVESVKAASEFFAPLSGIVTAVNRDAVNNPAIVNADPRGAGWLFKLALSSKAELDSLLSESAYQESIS